METEAHITVYGLLPVLNPQSAISPSYKYSICRMVRILQSGGIAYRVSVTLCEFLDERNDPLEEVLVV